MQWKNIDELREGLQHKKFSCVDLATYYLDRIGRFDPIVKAFLSLDPEAVKKHARKADERIKAGKARVLEGIPIAIKDNMMQKGVKTTAGSKILKDYTATYTATAVKRLEDEGAIIIGKTNLDEFAMGSSTEHSGFFSTTNPHDEKKVPGGSSGGSAAAVTADFCAAALGSDTGGSVRQPAGFCGIVGFKPTYGRVSRFGLVAMSSSLDVISPLTRSVADAQLLYSVIAGRDRYDATTDADGIVLAEKGVDLKNKKIGVLESPATSGMDEEVLGAFEASCDALRSAGAKVVPRELPLAKFSLAVYYLMVTSEVSSNLARYDGIRYGTKVEAKNLLEQYLESRSSGFGDEAKRRILLGTFTLSKGYRDKYYMQAVKLKRAIAKQFEDAFKDVDCIISPTSPTVAFSLGERFEDPLTMYLSDLFTVPANIANLPAISIPAGQVKNLPVGLHLMTKSYSEKELFSLALSFEKLFGMPLPPARA